MFDLAHYNSWLRDLNTKKYGTALIEELWIVVMEMDKIKWSKKITNEQDFERIGEKRTLLNNILL